MIHPSRRVKRLAFLAGVGSAILLFPSIGVAAQAVPATSSAIRQIFHWREFLAPFHSVLLHYPIGFLTMAFVLEIYALLRPSAEVRRITTFVILLSLFSGLAAASLGMLRAGSGEYEAKTLNLHRCLGMSIPVLTLATLVFQVRSRRGDSHFKGALIAYRGLLAITLAVLVIAGHYGGNLTHGSRYLIENAPQFLKDMLAEDPPIEESNAALNCDPSEQLYLANIRGVFETRCLRCHGEEKQKGHYRVDDPDLAQKGGESGKEAIKPNDPLHSELVRRILLPKNDDEAMPPDGKQPLSSDEIIHIIQWIQSGARFLPNPSTNRISPPH